MVLFASILNRFKHGYPATMLRWVISYRFLVLSLVMWRKTEQRISKNRYFTLSLIYHIAKFFKSTIGNFSDIVNIFEIPQIIFFLFRLFFFYLSFLLDNLFYILFDFLILMTFNGTFLFSRAIWSRFLEYWLFI